MAYEIREVDSSDPAMIEIIHAFNRCEPEIFPELEQRHFEDGYFWVVYCGEAAIGFASLVPFTPFQNVGYFKRAYIVPEHRGRGGGLQRRLMLAREEKARALCWGQVVFECSADSHSNHNARLSKFEMVDPEQRWGKPGSTYWSKLL